MSLLIPATNNQHAAKIGLQGGFGSGKTLTATLIGIGLSKTFHNNAPLCIVDGENAAAFVADVCELEGVPLLRIASHSFVDMRDGLKEAEAECCGFIVDNYDAAGKELVTAFRAKTGLEGRRLGFHHRDTIMDVWDEWTRQMRASPLHVIVNGRLAWEWESERDDNGDVQSFKTDTKMRGQGGYEPDLLIELEAVRDSMKRDAKTRSRRGQMLHTAVVLKDRHRALNGRTWQWKDLNDYKAGDFARVFSAFRPHFDRLAIATPAEGSISRSSAGLFSAPRGENPMAEREKRVAVALGEIDEALNYFWPSSNGTDDKRFRNIVRRMLFGLRSDAAIRQLLPEQLESARLVMAHFESAVADPDQQVNVKDEAQVVALLASCKDLESEREKAMIL